MVVVVTAAASRVDVVVVVFVRSIRLRYSASAIPSRSTSVYRYVDRQSVNLYIQ